jgi:hypothetical protein
VASSQLHWPTLILVREQSAIGGLLPSYEHKKIIEEIKRLDELPPDREAFESWILAGQHLEFLRWNARSEELVIYGSSDYSFVHAAVVPNDQLAALSQDDLLHWSGTPYMSIASYVYGGGRDDVWLERLRDSTRSRELEGATQLVFGRTFEGWSGSDRIYFEVNQEYTHVTGIHWRPEQRAYCRFDENGDLQQVVSVTGRSDTVKDVLCISFAWAPLEEYLAASNSTLVRRFDFTLLRRNNFTMWPEGPETVIRESDRFFYRQKVAPGVAAYTTGVQLIRPRRPYCAIFDDMRGGHKKRKYVEFIAHDWRNKRITRISTDPKATTNYFEAHGNSLPFEVSPAFFRPDVILKYKTDKDKYNVGERDITCRAAWYLKAFDINEAGQVFAYICYLRNLPYAEQLHWQSYNEEPKAGISERAITNDFKGEFTTFNDPLQEVLSIVKSWQDTSVPWWTLREDRLFERVSTPLTTSRDEWAEAFMDLAKLVVEGFVITAIRAKVERLGISYEQKEQSIALLERLINGAKSTEKQQLTGLRTIQLIRTKVKGHASGREVETLVQEVLAEHESFTKHFKHVCTTLAFELQTIAGAFA